MPHIVPDRSRFSTTQDNHRTQTHSSHSTSCTTTKTPQQDNTRRVDIQGDSHIRNQTKTLGNSERCLLYAPPCASKNHPQGQNGASHGPYEPAGGQVHCVEGKKGEIF